MILVRCILQYIKTVSETSQRSKPLRWFGCGKCGDFPQGDTGITLAFWPCVFRPHHSRRRMNWSGGARVAMSLPPRCAFFIHTYRYLHTTLRLHRCCTSRLIPLPIPIPGTDTDTVVFVLFLDAFRSAIPLPTSQHHRMKIWGISETGTESPQQEDTRSHFEGVESKSAFTWMLITTARRRCVRHPLATRQESTPHGHEGR